MLIHVSSSLYIASLVTYLSLSYLYLIPLYVLCIAFKSGTRGVLRASNRIIAPPPNIFPSCIYYIATSLCNNLPARIRNPSRLLSVQLSHCCVCTPPFTPSRFDRFGAVFISVRAISVPSNDSFQRSVHRLLYLRHHATHTHTQQTRI